MSMPFSLRLPDPTVGRLESQAARRGEPPRTLAQRYIEEGLRRDLHPLVRFADGAAGRRAALIGTGLDVWEVIATVKDNAGDLIAAADYLDISPALVDAAANYYGAFPNEIDLAMTANRQAADEEHAGWQAGRRTTGT